MRVFNSSMALAGASGCGNAAGACDTLLSARTRVVSHAAGAAAGGASSCDARQFAQGNHTQVCLDSYTSVP